MIYMIYAPSERPEITDLVEQLSTDFHVFMAPVGYQAASDEWKDIVRQDMQQCKVAVTILSQTSTADETVAWRFALAEELKLHILPMLLDQKDWGRLDSGSIASRYLLYNWIPDKAYLIQQINRLAEHGTIQKKPREVLCFFSYSRSDNEFAAKLAGDLRGAGAKTWRDAENIPAGANWDREIEKAIRDCSHVIFVATPSSVASENVQDEIGMAINKDKTVIPVLVEACELPLRVHRAQWVDFRENYDAALEKLCVQLGLKRE